jgi:hypothetical protein
MRLLAFTFPTRCDAGVWTRSILARLDVDEGEFESRKSEIVSELVKVAKGAKFSIHRNINTPVSLE